MQKFVFDSEAGKIALEMRNLIACTSFLVEQNLVIVHYSFGTVDTGPPTLYVNDSASFLLLCI